MVTWSGKIICILPKHDQILSNTKLSKTYKQGYQQYSNTGRNTKKIKSSMDKWPF